MKYGLVGKFTAHSGKRDQLSEILIQAATLLKQNKECIHYVISLSDEPDAVWVTEAWDSKETHDASLKHQDVQALIGRAMPLIASLSDQTELQVIGGKGL